MSLSKSDPTRPDRAFVLLIVFVCVCASVHSYLLCWHFFCYVLVRYILFFVCVVILLLLLLFLSSCILHPLCVSMLIFFSLLSKLVRKYIENRVRISRFSQFRQCVCVFSKHCLREVIAKRDSLFLVVITITLYHSDEARKTVRDKLES